MNSVTDLAYKKPKTLKTLIAAVQIMSYLQILKTNGFYSRFITKTIPIALVELNWKTNSLLYLNISFNCLSLIVEF